MSQKRKRPDEDEEESQGRECFFRSAPVEDRASTFIGFFSPSMKPKELQKLAEIKTASHKMLAWRRESNQQAINGSVKYVTDSDDDGEKYGGKRIEKVLESMKVTGSSVVARWYGGVLLGPVRFEHIETCVRGSIERWRDAESEEVAKKQKREQDASDVVKLQAVLVKRDASIVVLRNLAMEKEAHVKRLKAEEANANGNGKPEESTQAEASSVNKASVDYEGLTADRLRALEKGRDATLAFLLKRIDKAELELKQLRDASSTQQKSAEPPEQWVHQQS